MFVLTNETFTRTAHLMVKFIQICNRIVFPNLHIIVIFFFLFYCFFFFFAYLHTTIYPEKLESLLWTVFVLFCPIFCINSGMLLLFLPVLFFFFFFFSFFLFNFRINCCASQKSKYCARFMSSFFCDCYSFY